MSKEMNLFTRRVCGMNLRLVYFCAVLGMMFQKIGVGHSFDIQCAGVSVC